MHMHAQVKMERKIERDFAKQADEATDTQEKSDLPVRIGVGGLSTARKTHCSQNAYDYTRCLSQRPCCLAAVSVMSLNCCNGCKVVNPAIILYVRADPRACMRVYMHGERLQT